MYVFQLFDYYAASGMALLWVCFFECAAVSWVYGNRRYYDNLEYMLGYRLNPWLRVCWTVLTPILTCVRHLHFITTGILRMGKVLFSVCPQHLGEGVTLSPSHYTSIGPMSFVGGTPVTGPKSLLEGTRVPVPGVGYPPAGQDWSTPPPPSRD